MIGRQLAQQAKPPTRKSRKIARRYRSKQLRPLRLSTVSNRTIVAKSQYINVFFENFDFTLSDCPKRRLTLGW
jgi:hypothetical protein